MICLLRHLATDRTGSVVTSHGRLIADLPQPNRDIQQFKGIVQLSVSSVNAG